MKKSDFEYLTNLLKQNAGWDFNNDQYFIVDKKISNFIREKGYSTIEDLIAELKIGQRALIYQVVENLALSDTSFFRDYDVFSRFEKSVIPNLRENNRASKRFRIWSLGCSTGQETYSIAFAIKKVMLGLSEWDIDIIGSDLSSVAISRAQKGIYNSFEVQMGLNARMIIENFTKDGEMWQVNEDIRKMVEFRRYNLLDDITSVDKFDVIFCRNVLRFFTPEYQRQFLAKLSNCQPQDGILYLGKNEYIDGVDEFYNKVSGFNCLYQSKNINYEKPRLSRNLDGSAEEDVMPSFVRPDNVMNKRPLAADLLHERIDVLKQKAKA